mgnify:CR=1 FL=1
MCQLMIIIGVVEAMIMINWSEGAVESFCPTGSNPDANVVLCEDFESKTVFLSKGNPTGWDNVSEFCCNHGGGIPPPPSEATEVVACGSIANAWGTFWPGITGFNSSCAAWNEFTPADGSGHYADHSIPAATEYYFRWYSYLSDPFTRGNIQDKMFRVRSNEKTSDNQVFCVSWMAIASKFGNTKPSFQDFAGGDVDYYQNQGNDIVQTPGRWYLFEMYLKLGIAGQSNSIVKMWIDDASVPIVTQTLRLHYTTVRGRNSAPECDQAAIDMDLLEMTAYHQSNPPSPGQYQRWDQIVVSRTPIGPMGVSPPPPPAAVPNAPTELTITGFAILDQL